MQDALTIKRDKIIEIVKEQGPLLPMIIMKGLEIDSTYAGAMLSEMVSSKMLKITNVKRGGSPFYYLEGQEERLENLMPDMKAKLITYPVPKAILEEWKKHKVHFPISDVHNQSFSRHCYYPLLS